MAHRPCGHDLQPGAAAALCAASSACALLAIAVAPVMSHPRGWCRETLIGGGARVCVPQLIVAGPPPSHAISRLSLPACVVRMMMIITLLRR